MNILVTGGAGYVGSHTARWLERAGHHVWIYDNLSAGHAAAAEIALGKRLGGSLALPDDRLPRSGVGLANRLVVGDLHDGDLLRYTMKARSIEAVMHFAAFALVGESVTDPAKYYQNNVVGTLSLLDAMRDCDVKRIVFSSTCATYGEPTSMPIRENTPQSPVNPYGFTKLAIEKALADYAHAYGFGYAALRYFNASGASPDGDMGEDHTPESHLIPLVLQVALGQRSHITIFGNDYPTPDGTCIRDYIHVDDLAAAHAAALLKLGDGTQLKLNLGTGRGTSVREVIDACRRVTGREIAEQLGVRRPGDPAELVADATAARETLGWQAKYVEIEPIVKTAWRWHVAHPRGYASVHETASV
jgi:UDP-glucose 4-epimerase